MNVALQGLAADHAAEPHAAIESTGEIADRGVHAQIADRTSERRRFGSAQHRGEVGSHQGAGEAPLQRGAPGQLVVEGSKILEVEAEPRIGETRRGPPFQSRDHLGPFETGLLEGVAVIDLGQAPVESWGPAEKSVEDRMREAEPLRAQIHIRRHGLAGGVAAERRPGREAAGERATGQTRIDREVAHLGLDLARQDVLADPARIGGLGIQPFDAQARHRERVVGLERGPERQGGARPDGVGERRIGEREALDPRIGAEGETARLLRSHRHRFDAGVHAVESAVAGAQARRLERSIDLGTGERPLQAGVEDEALQFRLGGLRHAALGRHGTGRDGEVGHSVGAEAAARIEASGARGEFQPVDAEAAAVGEAQGPVELGRAREHGGNRAGQQALDARGEIEAEAPLGADARDLRGSLGADALARVEIEARIPRIESAAPIEVEVDGRRTRHVQTLREQAAGGLRQRCLHLQPLALRHEQEPRHELPGRIEAMDAEIEVEALRGGTELHLALRLEPGRLSRDGLAKHQLREAEPLDLDLHGQVRQQRAVGLRRISGRGGQGTAQDLEASEFEAVDLEAPRQEREATPDEAGSVELQPDAVAVADRHVPDGGVGGEGAVDRPDGDAGTRRREGFGEEPAQHRLLALVGRPREGGGPDERRDDQGTERRGQGSAAARDGAHA
ncbi:hypothetical protein AEGHOMDF_4728 [Methylobacterium soli]|nr:hypothetical protein AEGHOMDF_4728 [Methylobacterium soli]